MRRRGVFAPVVGVARAVAIVLVGSACHYDAYQPPSSPTFPTYAIEQLGLLAGGTESQANGGSAAAIVGWATDNGGVRHAVTFAAGAATRLAEPSGTTTSVAWGVNASGTIVGVATLSGGVRQGLVWPGATAAPIELPTLGGAASYARGINDQNVIVGTATDAGGDTTLVIWTQDGATYDVAVADSGSGTSVRPNGIDLVQDIVGNLPDSAGAFFFNASTGLDTVSASSGLTVSTGLNNFGIQVGWIDNGPSSPTQAFVATGTVGVVVMGGPPTGYTGVLANSISDKGFIAGTATTVSGTGMILTSEGVVGSVVDPSATFRPLPSLGGTRAQPVNNAVTACGVILGWAATAASPTSHVAVAWVPTGCTIP
jgi:uncharacterized membrane protein